VEEAVKRGSGRAVCDPEGYYFVKSGEIVFFSQFLPLDSSIPYVIKPPFFHSFLPFPFPKIRPEEEKKTQKANVINRPYEVWGELLKSLVAGANAKGLLETEYAASSSTASAQSIYSYGLLLRGSTSSSKAPREREGERERAPWKKSWGADIQREAKSLGAPLAFCKRKKVKYQCG